MDAVFAEADAVFAHADKVFSKASKIMDEQSKNCRVQSPEQQTISFRTASVGERWKNVKTFLRMAFQVAAFGRTEIQIKRRKN